MEEEEGEGGIGGGGGGDRWLGTDRWSLGCGSGCGRMWMETDGVE